MSKRGLALYELIGDRPVGRRGEGAEGSSAAGERGGGVGSGERVGGAARRPSPELKRGVGTAASGAGGGAGVGVGGGVGVGSGVGGGSGVAGGAVGGGGLAAALAPGRVLRVPVGYVWFAVAGVVLVGVVAWALGYASAESAFERRMQEERARSLPSGADDPMNDPGMFAGGGSAGAGLGSGRGGEGGGGGDGSGGGLVDGGDGGGEAGGGGVGGGSGAVGAGGGGGGAAGGGGNVLFLTDASEDPRERGLNYYTLVSSFPGEAAREVAAFVGSRGIGVVAVPRGRGRFTVTTLSGITGAEYRANGARRRAIERAVADAGRAYEGEGGSTDFGDAFWDRLD